MPILSHIFKKLDKSQARPTKAKKKESNTGRVSDSREESNIRPQEQKKKGNRVSLGGRTVRSSSAMKIERAHGAYNIIVRPHISEKSVKNNDKGKYVFEIYRGINKKQAAKAIESIYKVKVESVKKIKMPPKPKRHLRHKNMKFRNDKVIVTLSKGQEIEVLPQ